MILIDFLVSNKLIQGDDAHKNTDHNNNNDFGDKGLGEARCQPNCSNDGFIYQHPLKPLSSVILIDFLVSDKLTQSDS